MKFYIFSLLKWTASNYICSVIGGFLLFVAVALTPYYSGFHDLTGEPSYTFEIYWNIRLWLISSARVAITIVALMTPVYFFIPYFETKKLIHVISWTIIGTTYAYFRFGYLKAAPGDYSPLLLLPYGIVCGLLSVPINKLTWKYLPLIIPFIRRLHEIQITR